MENMSTSGSDTQVVVTTATVASHTTTETSVGARNAQQSTGNAGLEAILSKLDDLAGRMTHIEAEIQRPLQPTNAVVTQQQMTEGQ